MIARKIRIRSMGKYLPELKVLGKELDRKLGLSEGSTEKISGVQSRHFASPSETNSKMGARAARMALDRAGLKYEDLDAIISASGSIEQIIPCGAALLQKELGGENSGTPSFDINSTCLSFVTALDVVSFLISAGKYKRVLIVSSEIASIGLNWSHLEAASLFGDGAVAAIVEAADSTTSSRIISSHMETYSSGSTTCQIEGGGSKLPAWNHSHHGPDERFLFSMDGRKAFRMASEKLPAFLKTIFDGTGHDLSTIKMIVPHQASMSGMELLRRRMGVEREKWMEILPNHGNCIAASIPMALFEAIEQRRISRGDTVLLMGTSAGLSIGGVLLEY